MSSIYIEYFDPGKSMWTGRSVKKLEINGVEIDRVHGFELYIASDGITHVKIDMMVDKLSINPVARSLGCK